MKALKALTKLKEKYHHKYWHFLYPLQILKDTKKTEEYANKAIIESIESSSDNLGMYINLPFCEFRCKFCFLPSFINQDGIAEKFFKILQMEMENKKIDKSFDYLHFGGGTPTVLSAEELDKLFNLLNNHYSFKKDTRKLIETTIESIDEEKIKILKKHNFDRILIGVQSFDNTVLKKYNREIDFDRLIEITKIIKRYKISLSIDLMLGLREENEDTINNLLYHLKIIDPDQVCYTEFFPDTVGFSQEEKDRIYALHRSNDKLYEKLQDTTESLGYVKMFGHDNGYYFTKSDELHTPNLNLDYTYKYFDNVIGFGPFAESRFKLPNGNLLLTLNSMKAWQENKYAFRTIEVTKHEHIRRNLMYSFFFMNKISIKRYREYFGNDFLLTFKDIFEPLQNDGLITIEGDNITLKYDKDPELSRRENYFVFAYKYFYSDDMRSAILL